MFKGSREVPDELKEIVFGHIIRNRKIRFDGNGLDYSCEILGRIMVRLAFCLMDCSACNLCVFLLYSRARKELTGNVLMLTGQSHVSQGLIVQVPDSDAEGHFSANESRYSELLLSSRKGPGASHAGQDTTACASSLLKSSAGHSVSLPEQGLLTQTSGLEYSQPGLVGRVLIEREVSSASTIRHTPDPQADAGASRVASGRLVTSFLDETGEGTHLPRGKFVFSSNQLTVLQSFFESNRYPSREEKEELARQCDLKLRQVVSWFGNQRNRDQPCWRGNEKGNAEKALPVVTKEDSPRVLSSRAARPSIAAGLLAETTRHTPDSQADAGASQVAGSHPVTFSDETEEGAHSLCDETVISLRKYRVLRVLSESNCYSSIEEKEALARQCGLKLKQGMSWFRNQRNRDQPNWKGNEKGNTEKALPVVTKEDSSRVLSSRAARPSIAGSPAETTRHTPDPQADAGASQVVGGHSVTFSDETGEGTHLSRGKFFFSPSQLVVLQSFFESNRYPSREEKEELARQCSTDFRRVTTWFAYKRSQDNKCKRSREKGDEERNTEKALPVVTKEDSSRVLSSRAARPSIAGSPAETTRHTPDPQADAGASQVVGGHSVTFSDETGEGTHLSRGKFFFSPSQLVVLQSFFESNRYPSREEKEELARQCSTDFRRVTTWFAYKRSQDNKCKRSREKGDEERNTGKALPVTPKEDLPRVLSSRAVCPSIAAGLPAETPLHTPDSQADAGASQAAGGHPVTFSDETEGGAHSLCDEPVISLRKYRVLRVLFESNRNPSREKKEELARRCGIGLEQIDAWFTYWNHQNNECKRGNEKGDEEKNAEKALPVVTKEDSSRVLSSRAARPSIAGSPAKKARHTSDTQADAGVSRVASGRLVTSFLDETGGGTHLSHRKSVFSSNQLTVLWSFYKSNRYPSREEKKALARQCGLKLRQVVLWFRNRRNRGQADWKGNEKGNAEKALPVVTKEDSSRVLSSRAARPSIAGSPAKKARHTSDTQADAGASRIIDSRSVIFSDSMRSLCRPRRVGKFSVQDIAGCEALYNATGGFPDREQKDNLANELGVDSVRIDDWFKNTRRKKKKSPDFAHF